MLKSNEKTSSLGTSLEALLNLGMTCTLVSYLLSEIKDSRLQSGL